MSDSKNAKLIHLRFEYDPKQLGWTPYDLYLRTIFGNKPFTMTENDFSSELSNSSVSAATEEASGRYVEFGIKDPSRWRGYDRLMVQIDRWDGKFNFANVLINEADLSTPQRLLHLVVVGAQYFRSPILSCDTLLSKDSSRNLNLN